MFLWPKMQMKFKFSLLLFLLKEGLANGANYSISDSFSSALLKEFRHKGSSFLMSHICLASITWGYENDLQMLIKDSTSVKW